MFFPEEVKELILEYAIDEEKVAIKRARALVRGDMTISIVHYFYTKKFTVNNGQLRKKIAFCGGCGDYETFTTIRDEVSSNTRVRCNCQTFERQQRLQRFDRVCKEYHREIAGRNNTQYESRLYKIK